MSVKIKRERPDQRRHHRVTAPLFVSVAGHSVRATDWSLGGLRIDDFPGDLPAPGDELSLQLTLPFQGFDVSFVAKAEVVRNDPSQAMFALRFTEIGERERELMQHFIEELVRGAMSHVEDTIQRIDVPVTPASLEPDVKPAMALPGPVAVRRFPVKTLVMGSIYLVLGAIVFGYAGLLGYSNFFRLEVQTAVIAAPVENVQAQVDGQLKWADKKPGDPIRQGDVVLSLIDNQLEREIDLADIAIRERKAQLAFLKRRQADELDKAKSYATVELKNVTQSKLDVEATKAQLQAAEKQVERLKYLHVKGYTTDTVLETAEKTAASLRSQLEMKRVEAASRAALADSDIGRRLYNGISIQGDVEQIEAQVRLAEHEIELAQQRYIANLSLRDRHAVRAPFDGTVLELPRVDAGSVRRGDTIAIIEQRRDRYVLAYLTQDEVLRIGLGDEALVFLPAVGETMKARVSKIDRTSGFVQEQMQRQNPGYGWRGPSDRSAKVTLQFDDPAKVVNSERYRSGLPAVVVFERRTTNSIISAIKKQLSVLM